MAVASTAGSVLRGSSLRGAALRALREQRGLSGAEVARRAEVSRPYLVQIEKGERKAPDETWRKILDAIGVTPDELNSTVALLESHQAQGVALAVELERRQGDGSPAR